MMIRQRFIRILLVLIISGMVRPVQAQPPAAKPTIIVNSLEDTAGNCPEICTLRAALAAAKDGDVIGFAADLSGTIKLTSVLKIDELEVTILGSGTDKLIIDAQRRTQVLALTEAKLTMEGLTIQNGLDRNSGAIVLDDDSVLNLKNSALKANTAGSKAGAIESDGELTIDNVLFEANTAGSSGGALLLRGKTVIQNSTFAGNQGGSKGGAIEIDGSDTEVEITNSTFTANTTGSQGGAIYNNGGKLSIGSATIFANIAGSRGGGIYSNTPFKLQNSIVAKNIAGSRGSDIYNAVESGGYNLIGNAFDVEGLVESDLRNVDPKLVPLALNKPGSTPTLALDSGSPAIGKGGEKCAKLDQRGVERKVPCDIGAYETEAK